MKKLKQTLQQLPQLPGAYFFKDKNDTIIYIGKAKNLFNRVHSYFNRTNNHRIKILVKNINNIEYLVTNNEVEALLVENNLIKKYQPKYNIELKDAKTYPMIKITKEDFPRIIKCREKRNNKDEYFGPFISVKAVEILLKFFRNALNIRNCSKKISYSNSESSNSKKNKNSPCLNYYIKKCFAPCCNYISKDDYIKKINIAREILQGKMDDVIVNFNNKMQIHSQNLEFEEAAKVRDQIVLLNKIKYQIVDTGDKTDSDFIGVFSDFDKATVSIIKQREGKILGKENFIVKKFLEQENVITNFLNVYYLNTKDLPKTVYIEKLFSDQPILCEAISEKFNINFMVTNPKSDKNKKLLVLSQENAQFYFEETQFKLEKIHHLRELKNILHIDKLPRHIEGFDIATLDGQFNTAALVCFIDGNPYKTKYRQFNIDSKGHPDDYAMMQEVVYRRYSRLLNEKEKLPDLIVVDGGQGQVNSATISLKKLKLQIPIVGLAKKEEIIYRQNKLSPIVLQHNSHSLRLLVAIRNESHRFSNTLLKNRYKNFHIISKLNNIPGIGKNKTNILLKEFGSINKIKETSIEELAKVDNIGVALAKKIFEYLHKQN